MSMTLEQAIERAEKIVIDGMFVEVMARLLEEVKKGNQPQEVIDEHLAAEPKGPLPAAILADMIDHQADELAELAKEIDIYNGLKHEGAVKAIGTFKTYLVLFAKQLRTETIEVKWEENQK